MCGTIGFVCMEFVRMSLFSGVRKIQDGFDMKTRFRYYLAPMLIVAGVLTASAIQAQDPPKMKMTTPIPSSIETPDKVETRLGTLKFFDGFPDEETVQKVYDNLDFERGGAGLSHRDSRRIGIRIARGVSQPRCGTTIKLS